MSRRPQIRTCLAAVAAVALAALDAHSQDKATGEREVPARPDPIADAKQDLERIKSVREEARLPATGLPRFGVPDLKSHAPSPAVVINPKVPQGELKRDNWLVDAMEKPTNARDPRETNSRVRGRPGKAGADDPVVFDEELQARHSRESEIEKKSEPASRPMVINPLTRYLGDWMTPQDYALLKPGLTSSYDPRAGAENSLSLNPPGVSLTAGGLNDFAFGGQFTAPPSSGAPPLRDNPYLNSIPRELPATVNTAGPRPIAPPSTLAPIGPPATTAAPLQPPTTRIPDFAKPAPDERYFKQLKRF